MDDCIESLAEHDIHFDEGFVLNEYIELLRGFYEDGQPRPTDGSPNVGPILSALETEVFTMIFDGATSIRLSIIFQSQHSSEETYI